MADKWKLGGTIIEKDGEKLLELRGVRMVNKRPTRATVYYRIAELKEFLYNFLKKRQAKLADTPHGAMELSYLSEATIPFGISGIIRNTTTEKPDPERIREEMLKYNVDKVIKFLKDRTDEGFSAHGNDQGIIPAISLIISSAFGFDIFPAESSYDDDGEKFEFLIPTFVREVSTVPTVSDISLPSDILTKEISTRMLSPRSSAMMNMASKSVRHKKYKYEDIAKLMPLQAFYILSKLYSEEKDPLYREYLFSLVMRAYSAIPRYSNLSLWDINDVDILATIFAFKLQITSKNMSIVTIRLYLTEKVDLLKMFVDLGVIELNSITLSDDSKDVFSIPDVFIEFADRWRNDYKERLEAAIETMRGLQIPQPAIVVPEIWLLNDLKAGHFTRLYNYRVMVDAIKKGYIKRPHPILSFDGYYNLLTNLHECSPDHKALIMKFIEPNPITDFFLGGIKPSVETMVRLAASKNLMPNPVAYCISYGMEFSDENINYHELVRDSDYILIDITGENILILKDLGNNRFLAMANLNAGPIPVVLRKLDTHSILCVEDLMAPVYRHYIEFIADASDEDLNKIIGFFDKDSEDGFDSGDYFDTSITDLEMYMRYLIKQKSVEKAIEDAQIEYAKNREEDEEEEE